VSDQIAVICASPPGLQSGMDTVDRGLLHMDEKHGFTDQLRFFPSVIRQATRRRQRALGCPLMESSGGRRLLPALAGDRLLGRFLHMRQYHVNVARKLVQLGLSANIEAAELRVRRAFLLMGQDLGTLARTLSFGGTLIFNTLSRRNEHTLPRRPGAFLKGCRAVWFRDVYSAFKASFLRGSFAASCLGVDCANLIDPDRSYPRPESAAIEDRIGIFFGRTVGTLRRW